MARPKSGTRGQKRAHTSKAGELLTVPHKDFLDIYLEQYIAFDRKLEQARPSGAQESDSETSDTEASDDEAPTGNKPKKPKKSSVRGKKRDWVTNKVWDDFAGAFKKDAESNTGNFREAIYRWYVNKGRVDRYNRAKVYVPPPRLSSKPKKATAKSLFLDKHRKDISRKAQERRLAQGQDTQTNLEHYGVELKEAYKNLDEEALKDLQAEADEINESRPALPPLESIYDNQKDLAAATANAVGKLGGFNWKQCGKVATVFYSIYIDERGRCRAFQGSTIHAPDHPQARLEPEKAVSERQFSMLKRWALPMFSPEKTQDSATEQAETSTKIGSIPPNSGDPAPPQPSPPSPSPPSPTPQLLPSQEAGSLMEPSVKPKTPSKPKTPRKPKTPLKQAVFDFSPPVVQANAPSSDAPSGLVAGSTPAESLAPKKRGKGGKRGSGAPSLASPITDTAVVGMDVDGDGDTPFKASQKRTGPDTDGAPSPKRKRLNDPKKPTGAEEGKGRKAKGSTHIPAVATPSTSKVVSATGGGDGGRRTSDRMRDPEYHHRYVAQR